MILKLFLNTILTWTGFIHWQAVSMVLNFWFCKRQGTSYLAEQLLDLEEGVWPMELVLPVVIHETL
jgi:hypothetical protein